MGLESENYSFVFKTGTSSYNKTYQQFERDFLSTLDANCNLFISNIFDLQALNSDKINLDHCFVPAHQTFTSKQLPHLCPLINDELLQTSNIEHKIQKLKFILEYCIFLGLKRVAINFKVQQEKNIFNAICELSKYFRKGKLILFIITQIGGSNDKIQQQIWQSFTTFRRKLNSQINIQLVLQLDANLPQKKIIKKWMGQHVIFLSIKQEAFVMNNKGYPVLSSVHEQVVKEFMRRHTHLILHHQNLLNLQYKQPYFKYLGFVLEKFVNSVHQYNIQLTKRGIKAQSLVDYLQAPLQPYIDNLDGQIYDIFQFDVQKYSQYEIALISALNTFKQDRVIVCYYVGSGKGLILSKLMNACKNTRKKVKVYCIEKNPYPLQTLKRRIQREKWSKIVQIVQADIKDYVMPEHPDIIFSQLLGGFGDNQLSPECIKWAEKNATKQTRIVPEKYTSFIRPISTHILHKQLSKLQRQSYFTVQFGLSYSPFKTQPVWSFQHPIAKEDNLQRKACVQWKFSQDMIVHGFEATFDCNLFEGAYFSIVPQTLTKDFYSWFPLFFSFKEQEVILNGQSLIIQIQRRCTQQKIWYQWKYCIKNIESITQKQSQWHNEGGDLGIALVQ